MSNLNSSTLHIDDAGSYDDQADWGSQPGALEGAPHSTGRLLYKGPDNSPESGIWACTPGRWRISVSRDEFCHFVQGRAQYRSDKGAVIDVTAGTCVRFPAGWVGRPKFTKQSAILTCSVKAATQ